MDGTLGVGARVIALPLDQQPLDGAHEPVTSTIPKAAFLSCACGPKGTPRPPLATISGGSRRWILEFALLLMALSAHPSRTTASQRGPAPYRLKPHQ